MNVESPLPTGANSDPVGLLVVHGIGSQKEGDTLKGFLDGMQLAYGDRLEIQRPEVDHAVLGGIGRSVHVFEVFWADLLHGETVKRTFNLDRIFETVWFPILNHNSGRLSTEVCSRRRVLRWTWILAPLSALLSFGLWGAQFLAAILTGSRGSIRESKERKENKTTTGRLWERPKAQREDPDRGRTILDDLMDQVVGDVFNYVHGVAKVFPEESEKNQKLSHNVDEIRLRFEQTAKRATDQGCKEIQVLAHSLGSVIAFLSMCPETSGTLPPDSPMRLARFYTIGSPLEKIRFFWTRLVERSHYGPAIAFADRFIAIEDTRADKSAMKWDNFFSSLDLVSGPLLKFPGWPVPTNHPARGLGGLITAHVAYKRNPAFLTFLGVGLTGEAPQIRIPFIRRLFYRLVAILENLLLPITLLALVVFGIVWMGGLAWLSGVLFTQPLEWIGLDTLAKGVQIYFIASIFFAATILQVSLGRKRAKELYTRF